MNDTLTKLIEDAREESKNIFGVETLRDPMLFPFLEKLITQAFHAGEANVVDKIRANCPGEDYEYKVHEQLLEAARRGDK